MGLLSLLSAGGRGLLDLGEHGVQGLEGLLGYGQQPQAQPQQATIPFDPNAAPHGENSGNITLPPPPLANEHRGALGDVLDSIFLGGAVQRHSAANLAAKQSNYGNQRLQAILATLPPDQQLAMLTNQGELGKAMASHVAAYDSKPGETHGIPGGPAITAPVMGIDDKSGIPYSQTPQAFTPQGQSLGGDIKPDASGLISSSRTGPQGSFSLPQKLAPAETPGAFTPSISGPAGLPQIGAQPPRPPASFPSASAVTGALPGATITSGLRTPAHNAAVGGVPNSYHLQGKAYDIVPQQGQTMGNLAAAAGQQFPGVKVLNEGNHVHIQPGGAGTANPGPSAPGWQVGERGAPVNGPPQRVQGLPGLWQPNNATGKLDQVPDSAPNPLEMKKTVLGDESYKQATAALAAFNAMKSNASKMTGVSAYSILDTFARAINPGAVARSGTIEAIKQSLGPYAKGTGLFENLQGKGDLTPQVRQQFMDAVYGFVAAHYDQASALNASMADQASRHGIDPADVTAPLEAKPDPYVISDPSKPVPLDPKNPEASWAALPRGAHYTAPDGSVRTKK